MSSISARCARAVLFLALASTVGLPAAAQQQPRFLIESIIVEGLEAEAAREIVVAETLLEKGREYDEQQLKEALYRAKRLPFARRRAGAAQGQRARRLHAGHPGSRDQAAFLLRQPGRRPRARYRQYGRDRVDSVEESQVGLRRFVGKWGLLHVSALEPHYLGKVPMQVGYTRYNLFGRGAFASFGLFTEDVLDP